MVGEVMILLSLKSDIVSYTGISNAVVGDMITGFVFTVGILLVIGLLTKFIFKLL